MAHQSVPNITAANHSEGRSLGDIGPVLHRVQDGGDVFIQDVAGGDMGWNWVVEGWLAGIAASHRPSMVPHQAFQRHLQSGCLHART